MAAPKKPAAAPANPTDIAPGSTITLEITRPVNREGAAKTLQRLMGKSEYGRKFLLMQRDTRVTHARSKGRGGREWHIRMPAQRPYEIQVGEKATIKATLDVLRELPSVAMFVSITPA